MSNLQISRRERLRSSKYFNSKHSNSPTLTSRSEKSLWTKSYKNQPIPQLLRRRIIRKKYSFDDGSDDEEQVLAVLQEDEQQQFQKKKKKLPKLKVMSDQGEFSDFRASRIFSQKKQEVSSQRCRSVSSLKLPQVLEEKKEEDELKTFSKITQMRDWNEFGQKKIKRQLIEFSSQVSSKVQSSNQNGVQIDQIVHEQISENQAEQAKSVKTLNQRSTINSQFQKLIVDQVDQITKRRQKEEIQQFEIESILEQKQDQELFDTDKLRQSLSKFQIQSEYLNKIDDECLHINEKMEEVEQIKEGSQKSY